MDETALTEKSLWLLWTGLPGLGPRRWLQLMRRAGSAGEVLRLSPLERGSLLAELCWPRNLQVAIEEMIRHPHGSPEGELARLGIKAVIMLEEEYPSLLLHLEDPPPVLYYRGKIQCRWEKTVAIVGTRRPTPTGEKVAYRLAQAAARAGYTVISGLARGIDAAAHRGAMAVPGGETVAVLGHGLCHLYPPEHRPLAEEITGRGVLVTEFPPSFPSRPGNFPVRNRIIAALSKVVVVVEAGEKSGALITARCALELGREVLAVPGDITHWQSRGTNLLLRDGAGVITSLEDFSGWLGEKILPTEEKSPAGTSQEKSSPILTVLQDGPLSGEMVALRLGLSPTELWRQVMILELEGKIRRGTDGRYYLVSFSS